MKWYSFDSWKDTITEIEVLRETEKQIVVAATGWRSNERRMYKDGRNATERWFRTREECREAVLEYYASVVDYHRDRADEALGHLIELREKL